MTMRDDLKNKKTKIIKDPMGGEDIHIIYDNNYIHVYRNRHHGIKSPGKPDGSTTWFAVDQSTFGNQISDEQIILLVRIFESGHELGFNEGRWKLRKDLRSLLGIYSGI